MSSYCTIPDIVALTVPEELLEVARLNGVTVDDALIEQAIIDGSTIVDMYCSQSYAVPLVNPPDIIRLITANIAVFKLFERQRQTEVESKRKAAYDEAIGWLAKISNGDIALGIPAIARHKAKCNKGYGDRAITMETLGFM